MNSPHIAVALLVKIHAHDQRFSQFMSKLNKTFPRRIDLQDEPDHQELCNREQRYFLKAIVDDINLTDHIQDAINSLRIAFACDESVRTGKIVTL